MAMHSGILAWKIPWTEEPGRLQSVGSGSWFLKGIIPLRSTGTKAPFQLEGGKMMLTLQTSIN